MTEDQATAIQNYGEQHPQFHSKAMRTWRTIWKKTKMERFAHAVLCTMRDHKEWSSDTVDEICDHAYALGLAHTDKETSEFTPHIEG